MKTSPAVSLAQKLTVCCAIVVVAVVMLAAAGVPTARACSTPVYRYAMYNWPPMPYRIFYYHHGQPAEADEEVNRKLGQLISGEPAANVILQPVDVSKTELFEQYPPPVIDAWRAHGSETATMHVVFTPRAAELFHGRLEAATIEAMVDSPARKRLGELLHQGHVVVWLILTGSDAAENARAEKLAKEVSAAAAAGKIATDADAASDAPSNPPPADEGAPSPQPPADEGAAAAPKGLKVAVLKVSRDDAAEKWLVRSLMAVEPDLEKLTAEPMVFAIYGRGRAMPPCVGKGITAENLTDCLEFLAGPCSCMVKEENPGVDLLMRWDWEATAEAMAADDEELGGGLAGDRAVALGGPGGSPAAVAGEGTGAPTTGAAASTASQESAKPADATRWPAQAQDAVAVPAETGEALLPAGSRSDQVAAPFATRLAWKIGVGLAVGGIVVLAAGLVLLRLQRPG